MTPVTSTREGAVAVLAFGEPPVNSLGFATRAGLVQALQAALDDPAVEAVVVVGRHGLFSAGADIKEFGTPLMVKAPNLHDLNAAFEASPKPCRKPKTSVATRVSGCTPNHRRKAPRLSSAL